MNRSELSRNCVPPLWRESARLDILAGEWPTDVLPAEYFRLNFHRQAGGRRFLLRHFLFNFHRPPDAAIVLQRGDIEQPADSLRAFAARPMVWGVAKKDAVVPIRRDETRVGCHR